MKLVAGEIYRFSHTVRAFSWVPGMPETSKELHDFAEGSLIREDKPSERFIFQGNDVLDSRTYYFRLTPKQVEGAAHIPRS